MRVHASGPAAPDEVWDRYTRPSRWSGWAPQIRGVERHPGDRVRPGGSGTVRGPFGLRVPFTVDAVDDDARTWAWTVRVGPLRIPMRHGVAPWGDGGSRGWAEVERPRLLGLGYAPVAWLALRRLVR